MKDAPERFARFGQKVFDLDPTGKTQEQLAEESIDALAAFIKELGLDSTFTELGLDVNEEILRKVADNCGIAEGTARKLEREEVFQLLREVM